MCVIGFDMYSCPLCRSTHNAFYAADKQREYWQCAQCALVFVPSHFYLSAMLERAQYDLHENNDDAGYRAFLNRLAQPLLLRIKPESVGLDFGCGPGPVLATMLKAAGHNMDLFDIFYQPDSSVFSRQYDFITATEVIEHLRNPHDELARLWSCLRPGGYLGLMTKLVKDKTAFVNWHYKIDPTHVCFYSVDTFQYLANSLAANVEFVAADVIVLQKISSAE